MSRLRAPHRPPPRPASFERSGNAGRSFSVSGRCAEGDRRWTPERAGSEADVAGCDPAAMRAWAAGQGIEVSARGRIKADVVERFRAAGN
nr:histone-like nucleoid-structuring protein Lsr2 [Geodermatophilus africanus]